jgi:peptidoglycan/LPS O-acetylase OafA/YrhL
MVFGVPVLRALTAPQSIMLDVGKVLIGLFIVVPAVLGPQDHGLIRRLLRSRVLVFLGLVSYGLYLWQWFVLLIVQQDWFGWNLQEGNWGLLLLVGFPVILFAATVSWYVVERPILRWTHSVTRGSRASSTRS